MKKFFFDIVSFFATLFLTIVLNSIMWIIVVFVYEEKMEMKLSSSMEAVVGSVFGVVLFFGAFIVIAPKIFKFVQDRYLD